MEKKTGKIPCNARVDINYVKGKPIIKFGYTSKNPKRDAENQGFLWQSYIFFVILIFMIPIMVLAYYPIKNNYPEYCNVSLSQGYFNVTLNVKGYEDGKNFNVTISNDEKFVKGANFTCNNGNYSILFNNKKTLVNDDEFLREDNNNSGYWFVVLFLDLYALAIFVNILFSKWLVRQEFYKRWLPKHMAGSMKKRKKYYKFKPNDVDENILVIPSFKNVELIYNTDGEFSKYLRRIKIREERYNQYKKQKVGKLKINNFRWYAVFFFTKKPKTGFLEVIYQ